MKRKLFFTIMIMFLVGGYQLNDVEAKKWTMKITNEVSATHWKTGLMEDLAKLIEEKSQGRIEVKVYPGSQLFTDKAAVKALGTGAVQMVWPISVNVEPVRLEYGVINLPFAISDQLILNNEEFRNELSNSLSKVLDREGVKVMGLLRADDLVFVFKDARPKKVEDMTGLKVRVIGGQVMLNWVGALGVTPISMPASEYTTALSQGVIDGVHTSSDGWAEILGELGEYGLLIPELLVSTYSILADNSWFKSLPDDLQEVVSTSVDEIASKQWQFSIDQAKEAYDKIINKFGSEVYKVPDSEIHEWAEKTKSCYKWFADQHPEVFKNYVEMNKKYGRVWPPK